MSFFDAIITILQYSSIFILLCGCIILSAAKSKKWNIILLITILLCFEFTTLIISFVNDLEPNILLIIFGQFFSLFFLSHIYCKEILAINFKWFLVFATTAFLLLIFNAFYYTNLNDIQFYSDIIGCLIIIILSSLYFYSIIWKSNYNATYFWFNCIVFLFFSVEVIIKLTFNFLINGHLNWVGPIWIFRGVLLQIFYLLLIYYGWKTGKNKR